MNRLVDSLVLAFLGCCLLLCMGCVAFCGLVFWWLAYAGMVIGNGGVFTAFCLVLCGTSGYALLRLVMVAGMGLRERSLRPAALAGGPGL